MTEPKPAASVIVARDDEGAPEIFMLRRSARSAFMPDVYVFPGGRVDASDGSPSARSRITGELPPVDAAFVYAAARETFEEAGLLFAASGVDPAAVRAGRASLLAGTRSFEDILDSLGTAVDAGAFRFFSRWITPAAEPRRFDARFFVARAPLAQIAEADAFETEDGIWLTPAAALERYAAGTLGLVFPTIKHLERLAPFESVDALLRFAETKPVTAVLPEVREDGAIAMPQALEGVW